MGDGAADSAGKGEARVEVNARELLRVLSGDNGLDGIKLG